MDGLDLPSGEEAQLLQFRAVSTVDVDGIGMQVDIVIVEVCDLHNLFALDIQFCCKLFQEVIPQEKLSRCHQWTDQQGQCDNSFLKHNPPHCTPILVRR